jgi:hypothetical protein
MKHVILLGIILIIFVSGCTTETPAPPAELESSEAVVGEANSRRDNTSGAEAFEPGGGVDILTSDASFDELAADAYKDTFKDIPPEQRDPNCSNRADQASTDNCLYDRAIQEGNTGVCQQISSGSQSQICIRAIAVGQENPDACSLIESLAGQYNCISAVAEDQVDARMCDRIPASHVWNGKCLENVALDIEQLQN